MGEEKKLTLKGERRILCQSPKVATYDLKTRNECF